MPVWKEDGAFKEALSNFFLKKSSIIDGKKLQKMRIFLDA